MYVLGRCDDFIDLKKRYQNQYENYGEGRTLKEFGTLFVYDHILKEKPQHILEFGPGYNLFFSDKLARKVGVSYTCMDISNDELGIGMDESRFQKTVMHREANGHTQENCLLGVGSGHLPDQSYDCIFSISVVEHIDNEGMKLVAKEAARLLKPGGKLINAVDIYHKSVKDRHWHVACKAADLTIPPPYSHGDWHFSGQHTTFLEKQRVRYVIYNGLRMKDVMKTQPRYASQFATVLHVAHKPLA